MSAWENFYVILGTAGAALISVQFVVVTLVANMRRRPPAETFTAFATPTVVHFTGSLVLSAIVSAPWSSPASASIAVALCGVGGLVYGAVVVRRQYVQTYYRPVWQDWLWYGALPCGVYAALPVTALFLRSRTQGAQFFIAAAGLALLLIGIHNAWDSVTHLIIGSDDSGGDVAGSESELQKS
jgi:hypothetical protein